MKLRSLIFFIQKLRRGYSDKDLRDLRGTIANFILPRLISFKQSGGCYSIPELFFENPDVPHSAKEMSEALSKYEKEISKIILAFKCIVDENVDDNMPIVEEGLSLFSKYFLDLWY